MSGYGNYGQGGYRPAGGSYQATQKTSYEASDFDLTGDEMSDALVERYKLFGVSNQMRQLHERILRATSGKEVFFLGKKLELIKALVQVGKMAYDTEKVSLGNQVTGMEMSDHAERITSIRVVDGTEEEDEGEV